MIVMVMIEVAKYAQKNKYAYWAMIAVMIVLSGWGLLPRLVVNQRSLPYLARQQSKNEYVHQFLDGHIDQHLLKWHQLTK
jgi:hypothetical protein